MNLKETMQNWKQQAAEHSQNANQLGQNQEEMITLSKAELLNLLDSAAINAVEIKLREQQSAKLEMDSKLESTSHQLNQFREQQQTQNQSLKQETQNLREEVQESFDGLGSLIQEKLKPLDELTKKVNKQLSSKQSPKKLTAANSTNTSSRRTKPVISKNWSDKQNYSINHSAVNYQSPPVRQPPQPIQSNQQYSNSRETEMPLWMQITEIIITPFYWILKLMEFAVKGTWFLMRGLGMLIVFAPGLFFVLMVIVIIIGTIILYCWEPTIAPDPRNPFHGR